MNDDPMHHAWAAFQAYCEAKRRLDANLTFANAHDAAQAWVRFLNLYLAADQQMVVPLSTLFNQEGGRA